MVRCKVGMGFNSVHTMEPITTSDCSWIARWGSLHPVDVYRGRWEWWPGSVCSRVGATRFREGAWRRGIKSLLRQRTCKDSQSNRSFGSTRTTLCSTILKRRATLDGANRRKTCRMTRRRTEAPLSQSCGSIASVSAAGESKLLKC